VAFAGILTAVRTIVVRAVARAVVVVVVVTEEVLLTPITVTEKSLVFTRTLTECDGQRVAGRVASARRLTVVGTAMTTAAWTPPQGPVWHLDPALFVVAWSFPSTTHRVTSTSVHMHNGENVRLKHIGCITGVAYRFYACSHRYKL
jgi:hypothetical protein